MKSEKWRLQVSNSCPPVSLPRNAPWQVLAEWEEGSEVHATSFSCSQAPECTESKLSPASVCESLT